MKHDDSSLVGSVILETQHSKALSYNEEHLDTKDALEITLLKLPIYTFTQLRAFDQAL